MSNIKLPQLPDRMPVKLSISVTPLLAAELARYARLYSEVYGQDEAVAELIPAMLSSFLEGDKAFQKAKNGGHYA